MIKLCTAPMREQHVATSTPRCSAEYFFQGFGFLDLELLKDKGWLKHNFMARVTGSLNTKFVCKHSRIHILRFCGATALGFRRFYDHTVHGAEARATFRQVGAEMLRVIYFARSW